MSKHRFCSNCGREITDNLMECKFTVAGENKFIMFACPYCGKFIDPQGGMKCEQS